MRLIDPYGKIRNHYDDEQDEGEKWGGFGGADLGDTLISGLKLSLTSRSAKQQDSQPISAQDPKSNGYLLAISELIVLYQGKSSQKYVQFWGVCVIAICSTCHYSFRERRRVKEE